MSTAFLHLGSGCLRQGTPSRRRLVLRKLLQPNVHEAAERLAVPVEEVARRASPPADTRFGSSNVADNADEP